jgi:hypothetical protein
MLSVNVAQSAHLYPSDQIDFDSFGADPTGVKDSTAALQAYIDAKIAAATSDRGYIAVLRPGTFLISATLNLRGRANTYTGPFGIQGMPGRSTIITGSVSGGYLVRRIADATTNGPSTIRDIGFINSSVTGAGCVSIGGVVGLNVSGCKFNSHGVMLNTAEIGTTAPLDTFNVTVRDCIFFGGPPGGVSTGNLPDAIGILSHGQTHISGCDFTALAEGVRLSGVGFSLTGSRFEVNKIGMNLGVREDGSTWLLSAGDFAGISMEANDTAIAMKSVNMSRFSGILALGENSSPSGGSQYGIRMYANAGFDVTVDSTLMNGSFSVVAISALASRAIWTNVSAANNSGLGVSSGIAWTLPTDEVFNDHFVNCTGNNKISPVNQTVSVTGTNYTVRDDNKGKVVVFKNIALVAVSLPKPGQFNVAEQYVKFDQNWNVNVKNLGTGIVTITPVASTIDGGASIALAQYQSINIFSDGVNYYVSGH